MENINLDLFALIGQLTLEEVIEKVDEMKKVAPDYVLDVNSLKKYEQYGVEMKSGNLYFMGKSVDALSVVNIFDRVNFLKCNGRNYNGYKIRVMDYKLVALLGFVPSMWKKDPEDKTAMVYHFE